MSSDLFDKNLPQSEFLLRWEKEQKKPTDTAKKTVTKNKVGRPRTSEEAEKVFVKAEDIVHEFLEKRLSLLAEHRAKHGLSASVFS